MNRPFFRHISWYLIFAMFLIGVAPRVDAAMSPSEIIAASQTDRAADLERIQRALEMKVVKERLEKFGLTTEEVNARLEALNDSQMHQIAQQVDDLRVGKDSALGVIVALLIIAILVIVILQLTGRRVIVTK